MKKLVCIVLSAVMMMSLAGCHVSKEIHVRKSFGDKKVNIEELQKQDGLMFVINERNCGECTEEEYESSKIDMELYYDGTVKITNPVNDEGAKMSDDDYRKVYKFCTKSVEDGAFDDYKEDACDGTSYSFTFYDEDGEEHKIYSGYIYENDELNDIVDTLAAYTLE